MLTGTKVLDLTRVLAGPLCTMMLGDLGADVIKVERVGTGDDSRAWGPPFAPNGASAYYLSVNRNKLSIALDLDLPEDQSLVRSLIAEADIVVDNFRRGTLERRSLDPDEFVARHERLVWCTITGFGANSDRPGYDFVVQAESGWMAVTGEPSGDPMKVGVALADITVGKDAAISILAALVARGRTGRGRRLFAVLRDSACAALVNVAQNALVTGDEARRWGNAHPNLVPYQLFHTADYPIVVAVGSDAQWRSCARSLDLKDLAQDAELSTNAGRVAHRALITTTIAERLATAPAAQWLTRLSRAGVPVGVVKGILDAVREAGGSPITGMPPSVAGTVRLEPPQLDEHGPEIRGHGWGVFARRREGLRGGGGGGKRESRRRGL